MMSDECRMTKIDCLQQTGWERLKTRTKAFGLEAIHLIQGLPKKVAADVIGRQLLRSATSIGALKPIAMSLVM